MVKSLDELQCPYVLPCMLYGLYIEVSEFVPAREERVVRQGVEFKLVVTDEIGLQTASGLIPSAVLHDGYCHLCVRTVSYTHLRAHETDSYLVCRLLLEKKKKHKEQKKKK